MEFQYEVIKHSTVNALGEERYSFVRMKVEVNGEEYYIRRTMVGNQSYYELQTYHSYTNLGSFDLYENEIDEILKQLPRLIANLAHNLSNYQKVIRTGTVTL